MTNIRANLWKIYIYRFLSEFYLIVPILIPYYESNHLNSTQIFTIQASYALSVLILEIPSGYLADAIGKKKSYLILMLIAPTFLLLGLFQTILLIPLILLNAFLWGTALPLILDDINRLIKSEVRATIISVAHMVESLSYVVLAPLFGKNERELIRLSRTQEVIRSGGSRPGWPEQL